MTDEIRAYGDGTLEVASQRVGRLELPEGTLKDKVIVALDGVPLEPEDPDDQIEEYERSAKEVRHLLQGWQKGERSSRDALYWIADQIGYEQDEDLRPFYARAMQAADLGLTEARRSTPNLRHLTVDGER